MKTYARIVDGTVAELLSLNGPVVGRYHPSLIWLEVTGKPVQTGWIEKDGSFAAPPPLPQPAPGLPTLAEVQIRLGELTAQVALLRGGR